MGDRQAIVPHIGFELEGSLLDAAADENRPGLPQAAAGLRRLLQGLGPRRQDDGLHRRLHAEGLSNVRFHPVRRSVPRRRCEGMRFRISPACVWPSEPA